MKHRVLPLIVFAVLFFIGPASRSETTVADLPTGAEKAPEAVPHFADRVQTFVWRNWNLVPLDRLAAVLQTTPENVAELAASLGLPDYREPTWSIGQIYITLIRRNWHLLPYEQILQLVEMTPERLNFALQEDDFLWIKLGQVKPKCEPLRYAPPEKNARDRAGEIARFLERTVGGPVREKDAEPRFAFIDELKKVDGSSRESVPNESSSLRFIYSYFALYGDPLFSDDADVFPEGLLEKLQRLNVNGLWLHVVLRELAPGGDAFPEFGHGCEKRLENLRKLVARAKRHGIGIYLYMNEPRTMPAAFFTNTTVPGRAETAGVDYGAYKALCISNPDVQNWIRDALAYVFKEVPDLAGVFTISGSENRTHCNSHGRWKDCPKCREKSGAEITALANTLVEQGVHRASPEAKVLVWDWGWNGHGRAVDIIEHLPKNIWLMSVSEWALPIERGGVKSRVGEYSISSVGPGPRAQEHWAEAKKRGMKAVAKVQLNCTWEIAAVPYVPVMDLIAEHCSNLKRQDIDGMMLSWTLGGYPSANLEIPDLFDRDPGTTKDRVLDELAQKRYGTEGAAAARKAWTRLSEAYREYPYSIGVLYSAPVQMGPANLMRLSPTGYRATMVGLPYDDLNSWRNIYPPAVFAGQYEKMARGFAEGAELLEKAIALAPRPLKYDVEKELRYAKVCRAHFASVANQARFVLLRDERNLPETAPERKEEIRQSMIPILENEIEIARELYFLALEDSSVGFESSNHYFYVPNDLLEKMVACKQILSSLRP